MLNQAGAAGGEMRIPINPLSAASSASLRPLGETLLIRFLKFSTT